jgi:hypothetical protein
MQLDYHPIPIDLIHNQVKHKAKLQNKRQGHWLNAPGLALIQAKLVIASARAFSACTSDSGSP